MFIKILYITRKGLRRIIDFFVHLKSLLLDRSVIMITEVFKSCGQILLRVSSTQTPITFMSLYRTNFGVTVATSGKLWKNFSGNLPSKTTPMHSLWALYFLRIYPTETNACTFACTTPKTWRRWVLPIVTAIATTKTAQ